MPLRLLAAVVLTSALLPIVSHGSTEGGATDSPAAPSAHRSDESLAATAWQLVEIVSMNDRVDQPDDRSLYTVEFKADGTLQVRADCNRGVGSWTSDSPGQLQISQIAATQALCPPDSLHDRYIAQFPWVRSYVVRNGHLYLATMADGSIIEFEPMELPLAATVLGEEVRTSDAAEMQDIVLSRLLDRYAEEQRIEAADAEIDAFVDTMRRGMRAEGLVAEDDLTADEAAQAEQMRRDMGRSLIRQWKLNRALYRQYGGRIIFQQLGPEPLDAYRQYLEERRSAGDFTIHQKEFEEVFWRYFTTDSLHDFYQPGSDEEARVFRTPPWEPVDASKGISVQPSPGEVVPATPDDNGQSTVR